MALNANAEAMRVAAVHVEDVRNSLTTALGNLEREVSAAVGTHWAGNASQAFVGVMARYRETSAKLHQHLTIISDQIKANGASYTSTEDDVQGQIMASSRLLDLA